jgi:hypothetical protein
MLDTPVGITATGSADVPMLKAGGKSRHLSF